MGLILRAILIVLLITLVRFVLHRVFGERRRRTGSAPGGRFAAQRPTIAGRMVKDPQCGIYVATELALPVRSGSNTLHFCSERCRDEYLKARAVKTAAG